MLININNKLVDVVKGVRLELNNKRIVSVISEPVFKNDVYLINVHWENNNVNFNITSNEIETVVEEVNKIDYTYSISNKTVNSSDSIKAKKEHKVNGISKPKFSLMPQKALLEVAKVFTYGEDKYEAFNYSKGENTTVYIDAAMRHINAFLCNEDIDNETKTNHLANAAADLLMTLDNILNGTSVDDRNKYYK